MKKNITKSKVDNRPTLIAFILDKSGSMNACKNETISGFNGYIKELKEKDKGETRFTFVQFDSISIDTLYNCSKLDEVLPLTDKTFVPRGNTPLYDAIGKTVREVEKLNDKYKILVVTETDGEENSSSDWKLDSIKSLIKEKEDKDKWTFAHIGVGINGWAAVKAYSAGTQSVANFMAITPDQTKRAYKGFAGATLRYTTSNSADVVTDFWAKPDKKDE
jgi:uncharacterized protein YegL